MAPAPLSLDSFQRDAIAALHRDESVLVVAPTGAGKTLVADAAIDRALARGGRAVYTTPLKALSNQKHRDLAHRLGAPRVGLLTGDRSVRPRADVVVMTTEIVRALLHGGSDLLAGVVVVVLDEFHYLRDPERGSVWEEIVMDAPVHLQLVCLSATIPDVERVHRWLADIHSPVALTVETTRPVPLHHLYAVGNVQDEPPLLLPVFSDGRINEVAVRHDGVRHVTRGEGRRQRDVRRPVNPRRATLLAAMADRDLLPAIWFMLSRTGCERAVDELMDQGIAFNDTDQASRAGALAEQAIGRLPLSDQSAFDVHRWRVAMEHGLATHHGGLLPVQREAVETAFAAGLVKLAFATETLAVGINLPARATVIDRVTRPESQGGEMLDGDEFAQLAGRAGRRGLDRVGYAIVPWAPDVAFYRVAGLAGGSPTRLASQLACTPTMVASLAIRFPDLDASLVHLRRSLAWHLACDQAAALTAERDARAAEAAELRRRVPSGEPVPDDGPSAAAPGPPGAGAGSASEAADAGLGNLRVGDVIADPTRRVPLLVLACRHGRRHAPTVDALGTDARRVTLTPTSFRVPAVVVGHLDLDDWDPRVRGQARAAARALAELERSGRLVVPPPTDRPAGAERRQADDRRKLARLEAQVAELDARKGAVLDALGHEVEATAELLRRRGHLAGFEVTPSGRLLARIYHPQGLIVAEAMATGLLGALDPPELAGVAAAFRAGAGSRSLLRTGSGHRAVSTRLRAISELVTAVNRDEASLDRPLTLPPDALFADAMVAWARGAGLGESLAGMEVLPGDFLRDVRQTIELLDQVRGCRPDDALGRTAAAAIELLDRDAARIGMLDGDGDDRGHVP